MTPVPIPVIVLGGGPDAERKISLDSARGVAEGLRAAGGFDVTEITVNKPTPDDIRSWPEGNIFPVLHGPFGEGGPLQDLLESSGRGYVGSGPAASRLAMDKLATKLAAASAGIRMPAAAVINPTDDRPPIDLPLVAKPVHEGSSVGLHLCSTDEQWGRALESIRGDGRRLYMAERLIDARELTVGLVGEGPDTLGALPVVEIAPASGVYDFEAKYERSDTVYTPNPDLPSGVAQQITADALRLANAIGVRDLARVDFLLDTDGTPWLLELNTIPGFTATSLVPKAARAAGLEMPDLCAKLVRCAADRSIESTGDLSATPPRANTPA